MTITAPMMTAQDTLPPAFGETLMPRTQASYVEAVTSMTRRLQSIETLTANWDGYGAHVIPGFVVQRAADWLAKLLERPVGIPSIVPTPDGGVQLEWHRSPGHLELLFLPDSVAYHYWHDTSGVHAEAVAPAARPEVITYWERVS
jgi:hypothetical protein